MTALSTPHCRYVLITPMAPLLIFTAKGGVLSSN